MLKATLSQPLKHIICFLTHFNVEMFDYILAMIAFFFFNSITSKKKKFDDFKSQSRRDLQNYFPLVCIANKSCFVLH